jgi:carbon storage regulator CsrA
MSICDYVTAAERLGLLTPNKKIERVNTLILRRLPGQSIWIGNEIQIIVLGHFNGITHIGIEAPPEIKILRDEVKHEKSGNQND